MEIECKVLPPPNKQVVYHGPLSRFSRVSGRFTSFNAFLYRETNTSESNQASLGTLYFIDNNGDPFSCIIFELGISVKDSSKGPNAFSISGKTGSKIILQAPSSASKAEWVRHITGLIQGDSSLISSSVVDSVTEATKTYPHPTFTSTNNQPVLPSGSIERETSTSRDPLPIIKGILLKKGGLTGHYVRRWFELVQDIGLLYSLYGDSPRDTFQRVPLQGLSIFFSEEKRQIIIPPSGSRTKLMILKCPHKEEFAQWREAIQLESSRCTSTIRRNEMKESETVENCIDDQTSREKRRSSSLTCIDAKDDTPLTSSMMAKDSSPVSTESAFDMTLFGVGSGVDTNIITLTKREMLELEDLQSDIPCMGTLNTEEFLQSIEETYKPMKNTPGIELELQRYYAECLPYGLEATLKRLQQRFTLPIKEPYDAVNEHIVLLDLDVERVRECLRNTLSLYGDEIAIWNVVREMDYIIRVYTYVREKLLIRLGIAAFREQTDRTGLSLGVNGTIDALDTFLFSDSPSSAIYDKVVDMWKGFFNALQHFRLDFDVFDESEETIVAMEDALNKLYDWLRRNSQEEEEEENREEDLR
ncbi:uncharacterized protein TM35_000093330 [Trypanosoma theileri]|uniref:PH domain-containing protein n=1 Tax=Trypanosoma theileri TaxID=67003 RepID=A0A1X0P0P5_9TRYP|nr:uncharacterized protein TM35_000093330 [Trypanosoma theileri]ORC90283.1 hypothetical protein TM35_000093330 [Trypanosoma theileri]